MPTTSGGGESGYSRDSKVVQRLWVAFKSTDLSTDTCPRSKGKCAVFLDGTEYVVQTSDGRSLRLTEIKNEPHVKSENPALLAWIHEVLETGAAPTN
jgi:hypothetical protein